MTRGGGVEERWSDWRVSIEGVRGLERTDEAAELLLVTVPYHRAVLGVKQPMGSTLLTDSLL